MLRSVQDGKNAPGRVVQLLLRNHGILRNLLRTQGYGTGVKVPQAFAPIQRRSCPRASGDPRHQVAINQDGLPRLPVALAHPLPLAVFPVMPEAPRAPRQPQPPRGGWPRRACIAGKGHWGPAADG